MKPVVFVPVVMLSIAASVCNAQTTQPTTRSSMKPLDVDATLNRMLKPSGGGTPLQPVANPPAVDARSGHGAVSPGAPAVTLRREESFVVDQPGRLTRTKDGQQWEFTFDIDGAALQDPPMILLANLKLMDMESAVSSANHDVRFRVTGMVTEYHGRNYLLVQKALVVPDIAP